jgi:hypothetical protein
MLTGSDTFRYLLTTTVNCPTNHPRLNAWILDSGTCSSCGRTETYVTGVDRNGEIESQQLLIKRFVCNRCLTGEYYPVRY